MLSSWLISFLDLGSFLFWVFELTLGSCFILFTSSQSLFWLLFSRVWQFFKMTLFPPSLISLSFTWVTIGMLPSISFIFYSMILSLLIILSTVFISSVMFFLFLFHIIFILIAVTLVKYLVIMLSILAPNVIISSFPFFSPSIFYFKITLFKRYTLQSCS